ncbi:transglutaminase domain-containing protein [Ruminococcaceae bacterium OttesenSCG-928-D13]|nr:transglutaminase domain-containing protein [Ruminococcaceae bacterium OttesenSCG-928-D13]
MSWKLTPVPAEKRTPQPTGAKWVQAGVYLLMLAGCVLVWMLEYDIPKIPQALLGAALGAVGAVAVYLLPKKPALWLAGGGALAYAAALLAMLGRVRLGASYASALIYARFTEVFHRYYFPAQAPRSVAGLSAFGLFLIFAMILLAVLLGLAVLRAHSFWLSFLICIPSFWFAYAKDGMPPVFPTLMLFCAWCALLLKGTSSRLRPKQSAVMQLSAMVLCLVVTGSSLAIFEISGYQKNKEVLATRVQLERVRSSLEDAIQNGEVAELLGDLGFGYGTGTVGSRSVTRVNLAKSGKLGFGSGDAFTITGLVPDSGTQYLRGFSCDVYTGSSWEQSSPGNYPFKDWAFQPLTFNPYYASPNAYIVPNGLLSALQKAYLVQTRPPTFPITVAYKETPRYIHTPYGLTAVAGDGETAAFTRDAFLAPVTGASSFELYQDVYTGATRTFDSGYSFVTDPGLPGLVGIYYDDDLDLDSVFFEEGDGVRYDFWEAPAEYRNWFQRIQNQHEKFLESYGPLFFSTHTAEDVADYGLFAVQQYLQLPVGLGDELREFAAWFGLHPAESEADWNQLAYLTGQLLRGFGRYTLSPGRMPAGSDFVTFFLQESQAGYCVHYASAGVAILRALGVPSRYVEGYVIGTKDVEEGEPFAVPKKNSHAWVEVWQSNLGWVPLEVTPGGPNSAHPEPTIPATSSSSPTNEPDTPNDSNSESKKTPKQNTGDVSQSDDSSVAAGRTGGAKGTSGGIGAGPVLEIIGGFLLLAVLIAMPSLVHNRRFQKFRQRDVNLAVLAMYRYLEKLDAFGYASSDAMLHLAEKARFSQYRLDADEYAQMLTELTNARATLLETLPPFKRLWFYCRGL